MFYDSEDGSGFDIPVDFDLGLVFLVGGSHLDY